MSNTLYIENLPPNGGEAAVERLLRRFGPVRCTAAGNDPDMLRRRPGLALVELATPARANEALRALDGKRYRGATLRVRRAVADDAARVRWACHARPEVRSAGPFPGQRWGPERGAQAPSSSRAGIRNMKGARPCSTKS